MLHEFVHNAVLQVGSAGVVGEEPEADEAGPGQRAPLEVPCSLGKATSVYPLQEVGEGSVGGILQSNLLVLGLEKIVCEGASEVRAFVGEQVGVYKVRQSAGYDDTDNSPLGRSS